MKKSQSLLSVGVIGVVGLLMSASAVSSEGSFTVSAMTETTATVFLSSLVLSEIAEKCQHREHVRAKRGACCGDSKNCTGLQSVTG